MIFRHAHNGHRRKHVVLKFSCCHLLSDLYTLQQSSLNDEKVQRRVSSAYKYWQRGLSSKIFKPKGTSVKACAKRGTSGKFSEQRDISVEALDSTHLDEPSIYILSEDDVSS